MLSELLENEDRAQRVEPEQMPTLQPQRIFENLNTIVVMVSLMIVFLLQKVFLNGYLTLLLVSMLLAGSLEVPGNVLRLVDADSVGTRLKVKLCFLMCGTLSFYLIILFGLYFNRSCSCNGSV